MVNLILCGGVGSRLWPLSRTHMPKQFARIFPDASFFEATVRRNKSFCEQVFIASNQEQAFLAANQLQRLGITDWHALVEPVGRNTAPAIALAALLLPADEIMLVCPSDHIIKDEKAYNTAVNQAVELAQKGLLVTFGIKPDYPETGFGYIEMDAKHYGLVSSFKEKPNLDTATKYLESGRFFWNSGIFCFKAGVFVQELQAHAPDLLQECRVTLEKSKAKCYGKKWHQIEPDYESMMCIPSISIDYAVLEKSKNVAVVPVSMGWSDLGSYDALNLYLRQDQPADANGNIVSGTAPAVIIDSKDNMILGGNDHAVALIGVEDLLVVQSPDAVLISRKGMSQDVKRVVDSLKLRGSSVVDTFPIGERPWGRQKIIDSGNGYLVSKVEIEPGNSLAAHYHLLREEHWLVVAGELELRLSDHTAHFSVGDTVTVEAKHVHSLANTGTDILVLIETRLGQIDTEDMVRVNE